ncbi:MAG: stage III sporulation protein AG [Eubacteriales bacterium]
MNHQEEELEELDEVKPFMVQVKELLRKTDKNTYLIMGLLGILLFIILLPTNQQVDSPQQVSVEEIQPQDVVQNNIYDDVAYVKELEGKLIQVISSMEGCGKTTVMITLESTYEEVLQQDVSSQTSQLSEIDGEGGSRTTSSISSDRTTILEENREGESKPYIVKMYTPKVAGVTVVVEGGGNASVCKNITDVIQALFGIDAHKIKVAKMK